MRRGAIAGLLLMGAVAWRAQAQIEVSPDEWLDAGQDWLRENGGKEWAALLDNVDRERLDAFWTQLQKQFHGEYVLDLGAAKQPAAWALQVLDRSAETRPYADWLRTRMDYFDVADQLRLVVPAPPPPKAGQPPAPPPVPTPALERKVWRQEIAKRPEPTGAARLVPLLKPVLRKQKVPEQLVWLAEVESSFNPEARSPVGARGLFQLMPSTAKQLGLALRPSDERSDPEKSTEAAAKYLRYLHGRFHSWPLALAAYNAGEGTVGRLIEKRHAESYDAIAERLPAETQLYVPKVDATLLKREGIALDQLPAPQ